MNERQKRITRVISMKEYIQRRYREDMTKQQALRIATRDVCKAYDIDSMIEQIGTMIDEKR